MIEVKVYVDFENKKIYNEEEFEVIFNKMLKNAFNECSNIMDFKEWLENNYSVTEIFNWDLEEKDSIKEVYEKDFKELLLDNDYPFKEKVIKI